MAKSGGGGALLLGGVAVAVLLFVTGNIPGYNSGTPEAPDIDAGGAADKAADGAKGAADAVANSPTWFQQHPGVLPVVICLVGAGIAIRFWRGLNGFARATVLVVAAGAAAIVFQASR